MEKSCVHSFNRLKLGQANWALWDNVFKKTIAERHIAFPCALSSVKSLLWGRAASHSLLQGVHVSLCPWSLSTRYAIQIPPFFLVLIVRMWSAHLMSHPRCCGNQGRCLQAYAGTLEAEEGERMMLTERWKGQFVTEYSSIMRRWEVCLRIDLERGQFLFLIPSVPCGGPPLLGREERRGTRSRVRGPLNIAHSQRVISSRPTSTTCKKGNKR